MKEEGWSGPEKQGCDCIVLYLQPVLNPKSYDGARVLEASGRPMQGCDGMIGAH